MTSNVLLLQIIAEMRKGAKITLLHIVCGPSEGSFPVSGFKNLQFAINFFFAFTTNKAQGQLFGENLRIDHGEECFS